MKIAPYWERDVRCLGGVRYRLLAFSFRSQQEAHQRLEAKAHLLQDFLAGSRSEQAAAYLRRELSRLNEQMPGNYKSAIAEEELLRLDEHNVITRNHYGAEVLNSDDTCFLDVDAFPPGLGERLLAFLGRRRSAEERLLAAAQAFCSRRGGAAVRVYRTARGWRLMIAAPGLAPSSPEARSLFAYFHVDALYAALCRRQDCWRARLTPKPRRLGLAEPYPQPPMPGHAADCAAAWLEHYRQLGECVGVCRLVDSFGAPVHSPIVQEHDTRTSALSPDRRLA